MAIILGVISLIGIALHAYSASETNDVNRQNVLDTNQTNLDISEKTNAANTAMSQANLDWSKEQFERTTPSSMFEQYRSLGVSLYPALQAALGVSPQSSSSPIAQHQAASMMPFQAQNPFGGLTEALNSSFSNFLAANKDKAEIENINANTEKTKEDTKYVGVVNDVLVKKTLNDIRINQKRLDLDEKQFDLAKRVAESSINKTEQEVLNLSEEWKRLSESVNTQIEQTRLVREQTKLAAGEAGLIGIRGESMVSDIALRDQERKHLVKEDERIDAEIKHLGKEDELLEQNIQGVKAENAVKELNAFVAKNFGWDPNWKIKDNPLNFAAGPKKVVLDIMKNFDKPITAALDSIKKGFADRHNKIKAFNTVESYFNDSEMRKQFPEFYRYYTKYKNSKRMRELRKRYYDQIDLGYSF